MMIPRQYLDIAAVIAFIIIFISVIGSKGLGDRVAITVLNFDDNLENYVNELSQETSGFDKQSDWFFPILIILSHVYVYIWLYIRLMDWFGLGIITGLVVTLIVILLTHGVYFVMFDDGKIDTTFNGLTDFIIDMFPGKGILHLLTNIDDLKEGVTITKNMVMNNTINQSNNITLDLS